MSLFGAKDGDDQMLNDIRAMSLQQSTQEQFGYDGNHQTNFGFPGYAGSLSQQQQQQLQQQRGQLNMPGVVQQQQQQLYRNMPFNGTMSGPNSALSTPSRNDFLLSRPQAQAGNTNPLADPGSFPALSRLRGGGEEGSEGNGNEDFPALSNLNATKSANDLGLLGGNASGSSVFGGLGGDHGNTGTTNATNAFSGGPSSAFFSPPNHATTNGSTLSTKGSSNGLGLLAENNASTTAGGGLLANLGLAGSTFASTTSSTSSSTPAGKFGLGGLLDIIRSTDREGNALVLGTDLTSFGLNLNANESLYPSFLSPFSDPLPPNGNANNLNGGEDNLKTPDCYLLHPPPLKPDHLGKFQVETLFYMFYQMPRDVLQAIAAQELYRRDWRYHGELKIWLKPRTPQEIAAQGHANITFLFFDVKSWEPRLFNAQVRGNLLVGLVPEEEIRVKGPLPPMQPAPQQQQQPQQPSQQQQQQGQQSSQQLIGQVIGGGDS